MGVDGERLVDCCQFTANNERGLELFRSVLFWHRGLARLNKGRVSVDESDSGQRMFCDVESGVNWVIVGGESGPKHRLMAAEWAIGIRDQCVAAGVPFFFKQWGGRTPKAGGRELDGRLWDEMPRLGLPTSSTTASSNHSDFSDSQVKNMDFHAELGLE